LQRNEDVRRVTLITNESCACQHSSVPGGCGVRFRQLPTYRRVCLGQLCANNLRWAMLI
jgi:hypothetical protein